MGKRYTANLEIYINGDNDIHAVAKIRKILHAIHVTNGNIAEESYEPVCKELTSHEGVLEVVVDKDFTRKQPRKEEE